MKRSEVEDKLAEYAFGTMQADERATFEAELANYPDLLAEYQQNWQPLITAMPLGAEQVQLPAAMRGRVLDAAFRGESVRVMTRVAAAGSTMRAVAAQEAEQLSWWKKLVVLFSRPEVAMPMLAAMLIVTVASMAWGFSSNVTLNNERIHVAVEQQEISELLADRDVRMVAMQPTAHWQQGVATATYDPNKNAVYVSLNGPMPKQAVECQVWVVKGAENISLGSFPMTSEAAGYLLYTPEAMKNYDGLIVSWEKPGGATQPTQDWIVVQGTVEN